MTVTSDAEFLKILEQAYEEAWEIVNSEDDWKKEAEEKGDIVCSKKNKKGKKMYRIKVIIDTSAEKLIAAFENSDDITKWNTTLSKHQILKKFDNTNATISYQVTTPAGPGDMVSARDFFMIYKAEKRGDTWMQGGCSIEYPDGPKTDKKNVRAWNYPGGQAVKPDPNGDPSKCEFSWLMNIEFKGWLPGSIMELAMPQAQLQFVECVRKLAKTL